MSHLLLETLLLNCKYLKVQKLMVQSFLVVILVIWLLPMCQRSVCVSVQVSVLPADVTLVGSR